MNNNDFFYLHFTQVVERCFPHLKQELIELNNRSIKLNSSHTLFNVLRSNLEDLHPELFLKDNVFDESFKTKFSLENIKDLVNYVELARSEIQNIKKTFTEMIDPEDKENILFRFRVKTPESILKKFEVKKRPYINDLIGFQFIVLNNERFPSIVMNITKKLEGKVAVFNNLFARTHEESQKDIGVNSVHHKALHYYLSYEDRFPLEVQILPRFTFLWHQVNHDTLYKEVNSVSYNEELAIRYYGYLCNNIDFAEMIN